MLLSFAREMFRKPTYLAQMESPEKPGDSQSEIRLAA